MPQLSCLAVQASLGFVLPTLVAWRAHLQAVQRYAAQGRNHDGTRSEERDREVQRSQYSRICAPVLDVVDSVGGAPVPVGLAALAGFVTAVIAQQQ